MDVIEENDGFSEHTERMIDSVERLAMVPERLLLPLLLEVIGYSKTDSGRILHISPQEIGRRLAGVKEMLGKME